MMQWLSSLKIHDFTSTSRRLQEETKLNTSTASPTKNAVGTQSGEAGSKCDDPNIVKSEVKSSDDTGKDIGGTSTVQHVQGNNSDNTTGPADSTTVVASSNKIDEDTVTVVSKEQDSVEQLGDIGQVSSSSSKLSSIS